MMPWSLANRQFHRVALNFRRLVDLLLGIPATSAEAERGFSTMKLLKTKNRNRQQGPSLNTLLRIALLSPPEELFDPEPAVLHWLEACKRRKPQKAPSCSVSKVDQGECSSESDQEDEVDHEPLLTNLLQDSARATDR